MKNLNGPTIRIIPVAISVVSFLLLVVTFQCDAQSRTTLTKEEISAINKLYEMHYIGVEADGWDIDPDLWNSYSFQQRKNFTEKLSIYYKNYTEIGKKMSGFCYFYNMATKKKIARWYNNEYREY